MKSKRHATLPAKPHRATEPPAIPFALIVALLFLVLVLRRPDVVLNPQFWSEDSSVFFKDHLIAGLTHTLFLPFAGYLHFVPRLVAALASWFAVVHAPLIFNLCATFLATVILSLFALPAYRFLIKPDYLRVAVCVVAAGVFTAQEVVGTITNIQWFLSIGLLVALFYPVPERWAGSLKFQLLSGLAGLIMACTSPQLLILLPFVAGKLVGAGWRRRIGPLMVLAGMCIQGVALVASSQAPAGTGSPSMAQVVQVTLAAPVYRGVMAGLLGERESIRMAAQASMAMNVGAAGLFLLWLAWLYWKNAGPVRWSVLVAAYAIFASVGLSAARRQWGNGFTFGGPWTDWGGARYTLLGSVLIVYLAALTVERIANRRGPLVSPVCLLALFAFGLHENFRVPPLQDLFWPKQAQQIEAWIGPNGERGMPGGLLLHMNPTPHWELYLPARLSPPLPGSPWEGCLVRGRQLLRGTDAVFWIEQGRKVHVSPDWVIAHGLRWDQDVRMIRQSDLDAIPAAP